MDVGRDVSVRYVALREAIGRLDDDGSVAVLDTYPDNNFASFFASGGRLRELANAPVTGRMPYSKILPGLVADRRAAIYGIGLNFRSKMEATQRERPDQPTFFAKAPSALGRPGFPIVLPNVAPDCVDYEGEIGIVIAAPLFDATRAQASAAIGAAVATNDVTARDVMRDSGNPTLAKSFPGFAQIGGPLLDLEEYGEPGSLHLQTVVNGETRQSDRGDGMLIEVDELLALLSRYVLLLPGDVVLTGTPAGTGDETKSYLHDGDVVEVSIADLPPLSSRVTQSTTDIRELMVLDD